MLDLAWDKGPSDLFQHIENRVNEWVNHYSSHPEDRAEFGEEKISYLLGYMLEMEAYCDVFAERMGVDAVSLRSSDYTNALSTTKAWSDMSAEDQEKVIDFNREQFERDYSFRN